MNELNNALSFLHSKNIKISSSNEWFRDCCQFYISSNSRVSADELQNFVYEQWLLADLRELGERCLPPHISTASKCKLTGKYAVQVNEITNVGESSYSQLKEIRSRDAISTVCESEEKVPAWQPKRSRTLRLSVTDGVQNLLAIEFESIPALREPFIPGLKILLMGPIECRRGVLLLTPKNIEVIGGEVDSLLVCNAPENVHARRLNLEENPNPLGRIVSLQAPEEGSETESDMELHQYLEGFENALEPSRLPNDIPIRENVASTSSRNSRDQSSNRRVQDDIQSMLANERVLPGSSARQISHSPVARNSTVNHDDDSENDGIVSYGLMEVNPRNPANLVTDDRNQHRVGVCTNERRTLMNSDSRIDDSGNCSMALKNQNTVPSASEPRTLDVPSRTSAGSKLLQSTAGTNASRKEKSPLVGVVTPIPSNKRNAESPPLRHDIKSSKMDTSVIVSSQARKSGTVSLLELEDILRKKESPLSVKCEAKVTKLIQKPRIKNDQWQVVTEVTDGMSQLHVSFDDEFLEDEIFMISACEVSSQKDKIAANPAVKDRIEELIRNGVIRMLALQGEFFIRIVSEDQLPMVVSVS